MLIFIAQVKTKMLIFFSLIFFINRFHRNHNSVSHIEGNIINCQITGPFICFNHLTDQAFIWDQAAIWDRRLIPSSQKSEMKMSQTSPASRLILWHPSGQYLSSASEVVAAEETINPTSAHSKLLISAVMVAYICFSIALIILRDTLSWHARLLITHPRMFISGSSLAFFLPPPGSLTLLLSSSDSSVSFFRQSLTLLVSTEKRVFRVFLCIFYGRKFEFQVVVFIFLLQLWLLLCCHGDRYNLAKDLTE